MSSLCEAGTQKLPVTGVVKAKDKRYYISSRRLERRSNTPGDIAVNDKDQYVLHPLIDPLPYLKDWLDDQPVHKTDQTLT